MLHFISFGSGSSGNRSLIFTEKEGLLIDAGIGVRILKKHLKNYGLNISNIRSILVTHDHADHVKSVGSVSKDYHIPVYATEGTITGILHITNDSLADIIQSDKTDILFGRDYIMEEVLGLKFRISVFSP